MLWCFDHIFPFGAGAATQLKLQMPVVGSRIHVFCCTTFGSVIVEPQNHVLVIIRGREIHGFGRTALVMMFSA